MKVIIVLLYFISLSAGAQDLITNGGFSAPVGRIRLKSGEAKILLTKDYTLTWQIPRGDDGIFIYPVPVRDRLTIKVSNQGSHDAVTDYVILDIQGRKAYEGHTGSESGEFSLDVSLLGPGTYFLKIKGANKMARFIKN